MRPLKSRANRLRWCVAALLLISWPVARAIDREQLEAAIVYNILQFVEWPGEDALQAGALLVLCMDSESPTYASMRQLSGRELRKMQFDVEPFLASPRRCNVLFIDTLKSQRSASVRQGAGFDGALLVIAGGRFQPSEPPTIQLGEAGGRLAFDIYPDKARKQGLVISSRLLRLARKVSE